MSAVVQSEKVRNTTVELLRVICMLLIIGHHFVIHGGAYAMANGINKWISLMILPAGKICFNCFVAISAWYTTDTPFKAKRFFKVWLEILFYNLLFTALAALLGRGYIAPIGERTWLGSFFPILGNSHGFAAAYAAYYLLTPFLYKLAQQLTQRQTQLLLLLLFGVQVFSTHLGNVTQYHQPMPSEVLLFVLFYYLAFYLKRWPVKLLTNKRLLVGVILFTWEFISLSWVGHSICPESSFFVRCIQNVGTESSLGNILAGFAMLLVVKDIKMPHIPLINKIATTTLGILLYHDHNFFRPIIWNRFVEASTWYYVNPIRFIVYFAITVTLIFMIGVMIDSVRQLAERRIMNTRYFNTACARLDGVFEDEVEMKKKRQIEMSVRLGEGKCPDKAMIFSVCVLVAGALFWVYMLMTRCANINAYFVSDHTNTSMDYFNMLSNIHYGDPYYAQANYPALCFVFFRIMHHFMPLPIIDEYGDGFYLRENMIAQLGYLLFLLVCIVVIWEVLRNLSIGTAIQKILFSAAMLFSGPMLFALERGNILLLVLVCMMIFLALYDSDKLCFRVIAYLSLAIAAAIKIYPAVFGVLVLWKRRYKESVCLMITGAATFVVPFFWFNGFDSIRMMVEGISAATALQSGVGLGLNYSFSNLYLLVSAVLGKNPITAPGWIIVFPVIICVFTFFISDCEWKKLYVLTLFCIWIPGFAYTYVLILMFLPIISFYFRNKNQGNKFDSVYSLFFWIMMVPMCTPLVGRINALTGSKFPVSFGTFLVYLSLIGVVLFILIEWIQRKQAVKS